MRANSYLRVACAIPTVKPANPIHNAKSIIQGYCKCRDAGANLILFPELSLSGYTCADLFFQSRLLEEVEIQILSIIEECSEGIIVFGLPLSLQGRLFNSALIAQGGKILGIVPKTYVPDSQEYYENRWFASSDEIGEAQVEIGEQSIPFGTNFCFTSDEGFGLAVEICEDLWAPIPPSSRHAIAGAQILLNLSASNELVAKVDYRRELIKNQSARCLAAYIYCSAGPSESSTDTLFGGYAAIAENGRILTENQRFPVGADQLVADIDVELLIHERRISRSFGSAARREQGKPGYSSIALRSPIMSEFNTILRIVSPQPFVPFNEAERNLRCKEVFSIQAAALATRMEHCSIEKAVLGLSGGLDSTLALLVLISALERLSLPRDVIHVLTMPGFGTTRRTLGNVERLCAAFDLKLETIDIKESCKLQMEELSHGGLADDIAFENIQARYRTSLLMNKANMLGALVIGTGDLSELALGWCTFNGDHISNYSVNAGVPKTLVQYLIRWSAEMYPQSEIRDTLLDILDTPISPELLPPDSKGSISQKTQDEIGPYELHDFFLYYAIRYGFGPSKVCALAAKAFGSSYEARTIRKWLRLFYLRFFSQQFKRSCMPDGPKVGTISLSPRADWRMPSDAQADAWLKELDSLPEN